MHPLDEAEKLLPEFRRLASGGAGRAHAWAVMRRPRRFPSCRRVAWEGGSHLRRLLQRRWRSEKATKTLRALGKPIVDVISPHPFVGWQAAFDPLLTPGARNYWKSHDFADLSDGAIGAMLSAVRALPSPECEVFIAHVGGAMARVSPDATAWPNRAAHFVMNAHARWRDKADDGACIAWARELSETAAPFAMGSVYVNFMPEDESDRVESAYGANYRRLAEIKRRYDPTTYSA